MEVDALPVAAGSGTTLPSTPQPPGAAERIPSSHTAFAEKAQFYRTLGLDS